MLSAEGATIHYIYQNNVKGLRKRLRSFRKIKIHELNIQRSDSSQMQFETITPLY